MKADLIKEINSTSEQILTDLNAVDYVKEEICDKCRFQYEDNITQEQLDDKCQNCIVELIKGFIF